MPSGMASTTRVPTRFSTASTQWPTSSNTSGIRVWHSLRPDARVNHTSDESEGAPMPVIKPALDPKTVEVVSRTGYPEPFRTRVMPRHRRPLGDALGLTRIGVNLTMLPPGKESSMRHWHTHEDEFVYVVEGEVVLRTDAGEERLVAGDCAGFRANDPDGHHLQNRSDREAVVLEVGTS